MTPKSPDMLYLFVQSIPSHWQLPLGSHDRHQYDLSNDMFDYLGGTIKVLCLFLRRTAVYPLPGHYRVKILFASS